MTTKIFQGDRMKLRNLFFLCTYSLITTLNAADIPITSLNDSGEGTLRSALEKQVSGDRLIFDSSLSGTLVLQSALPSINGDIQIAGPSRGTISIDGDNAYSLLNILKGTVSIANLNFANGINGRLESAIYVNPNNTLILTNVHIKISTYAGGDYPIYVDTGGVLCTYGLSFDTDTIPHINLNAGILEVCHSTAGYSSFIVDGLGNIWVKNGEVVTLNTATSSPVDISLIADTGTAIFNGTSTQPFIVDLDGGVLKGNYTCLYVASTGPLRPGTDSTFGVNTTTKDWSQTTDGILFIKINPEGNSDEIKVGGYANIAGTLTLVPANGTYIKGTKYTFLTAFSGFTTKTFDVVKSTDPSLNFTINYNANSIEIEIQ